MLPTAEAHQRDRRKRHFSGGPILLKRALRDFNNSILEIILNRGVAENAESNYACKHSLAVRASRIKISRKKMLAQRLNARS